MARRLIIESQAADQFVDMTEFLLRQIVGDPRVDLFAAHWVVKQRCADPDRTRTRDQEFDSVFGADNAALANDGDMVSACDFVHLMYLEQGNRFDRWARQTALHITDDRPAAMNVDRHTHDGVDYGQTITARFDTQPGVFFDIGLVGR